MPFARRVSYRVETNGSNRSVEILLMNGANTVDRATQKKSSRDDRPKCGARIDPSVVFAQRFA
jgi:hypothetical protein